MEPQDNQRTTSFREKMAWVMVAALALASGVFFNAIWHVASAVSEVPKPAVVVLSALFILIIVAVATIGAVIAALSNVDEADPAADERDKQISLRASRVAVLVQTILLLGTVAAYFFDARSVDMLIGVMSALVLGQISEYLAQIWLYRRPFLA